MSEQDLVKELLKEELDKQFLDSLKEKEINWIEKRDWFDSWEKIKSYSKKKWNHKRIVEDKTKLFLLGHDKDTIRGKPQLIENVQRTIPLIRKAVRTEERIETKLDGDKLVSAKTKNEIQSFYFLDEKFDKRHDGFQVDAFALDFWTYRIISEDGKEYYVYSQTKLPAITCTFKGMLVEFDDFAELSRSLKIKSVSKIFFAKSFEPDVKILTTEQIVDYTKERKITENDWLEFLAYHKLGTYNRFPNESEMLRSAHVLSSKVDDWPLHLFIMGKAGSRKSMGYVETMAYKFEEEPKILEGGNSRIKALTPSFKEKPANLGYLIKTERMGFVDEIGKMIEFETNKHNAGINNILGDLNAMLEHKNRFVGSGNDNDVQVKTTGKFTFVTNPVSNKPTIHTHVGLIDPTTMSRFLIWVQDDDEYNFVTSPKGVLRVSPQTLTSLPVIENRKKDMVLKKCEGKVSSRDEFLTLYDTCNSFLSEIDDSQVLKLADTITFMAKDPMKSVWKPRAEHHVKLLIDGLCKHRCLFKDYDSSFVAKQEDYDLAERILTRMRKSWDTDLSPKQEVRK